LTPRCQTRSFDHIINMIWEIKTDTHRGQYHNNQPVSFPILKNFKFLDLSENPNLQIVDNFSLLFPGLGACIPVFTNEWDPEILFLIRRLRFSSPCTSFEGPGNFPPFTSQSVDPLERSAWEPIFLMGCGVIAKGPPTG